MITEAQYPVIQGIMTEVYETFGDDRAYEDFVGALNEMERDAVLIGNLNYQVENGGFIQWAENGYVFQIRSLDEALCRINTPLARQVKGMVRLIAQQVRGEAALYHRLTVDIFEDEDEAYELAHRFDEQYYAINDEFMAECERYFASLKHQ